MRHGTVEGRGVEQLEFLPRPKGIVNVASVPQRSPFRYPGGKTWLIPCIRQWLRSLASRPGHFVEPFAGGGIVSLTVAAEGLADRVTMVELDEDVGAVWETILTGDAEWLVEHILAFDVSVESVRAQLAQPPASTRERAFHTILKNRCFHGGILAAGSGLIKEGENGKGIRSRWYPETLGKRILAIVEFRDRITFLREDGIAAIQEHGKDERAAFFIDPPYTAGGKRAGRRLYTHSELDHELLFSVSEEVCGDFLMTYDIAEEIVGMARQHGFQQQQIPMKNTHHAKMHELLIGKDLSWVDM